MLTSLTYLSVRLGPGPMDNGRWNPCSSLRVFSSSVRTMNIFSSIKGLFGRIISRTGELLLSLSDDGLIMLSTHFLWVV